MNKCVESKSSGASYDTRYISCLPTTYVLVVASPHLIVHALIGLTRQTHKLGAARVTQEVASKKESLKRCTPTNHDSTRIDLRDLPAGKAHLEFNKGELLVSIIGNDLQFN